MYYTPDMMSKTNEPIKQESSKHFPVVITSLMVWAGIAVGAIGLNNFFQAAVTGVIIGISYLIYIIATCCCSDVRGFITNLKAFDDYKNMYDIMVNGKGYFNFWIECYHYETQTDGDGNTSQEKVVTHTASQRYNPIKSEDDSGSLTGIKDIAKYVFITYMKKYFFADQQSAQNYERTNNFISCNRRD